MIIDALLRAASDGVNVINLSLGGAATFYEDSAMTPIIQSLISQGIVVVIAAGNSGEVGVLTNSIPAIVPGAISVGSVDNLMYPYVWNATLEGGQTLEFASLNEWLPEKPLTIW